MGEKISKVLIADLVAKGATVGPSAADMIEAVKSQVTGPSFRMPVAKTVKGPNKLEQAYAAHLEVLKRAGEIVDYKFESVKLKIGVATCWYCPDFWVLANDGVSEFHETKGWMRDDAAIKLKSAAFQYPHFRFFLVRKEGKRFSVEAVK